MLNETLRRLEEISARIEKGDYPEKEELLSLFVRLKKEVAALPPSRHEEARSMANFAMAATDESSRGGPDEKLKALSLEGLSHSVRSLEASHPVIVDTVNDICLMLSRIGI